jgi:hypothetical protein
MRSPAYLRLLVLAAVIGAPVSALAWGFLALVLSCLPGVPAVAGIAIGVGAMIAAVLRLPMTAVLVATLLLYGNGVGLLPPIIVAAVTAYIAVGWLDRAADARPATSS